MFKNTSRFLLALLVSMFVFLLGSTYILYYDRQQVVLVDYEVQAEGKDFIPVLMFHEFQEGTSSSLVVEPEQFREQLIYLKGQGYEAISVYDLVQAVNGSRELPAKPLLITIDDGYLSNYQQAYPILQELEMKATINVVTSQRGKMPGFYPHFTWSQAQEMVDSGLITIQSHTHDLHHKIPTRDGLKSALIGRQLFENGHVETDAEYRERVLADLKQSKQLIEEHTGQQVISLSYPYGVYNAEIESIAKELGFLLLFTIDQGVFVLEASPYTIPRINVPGSYTGADIEAEILKLGDETR